MGEGAAPSFDASCGNEVYSIPCSIFVKEVGCVSEPGQIHYEPTYGTGIQSKGTSLDREQREHWWQFWKGKKQISEEVESALAVLSAIHEFVKNELQKKDPQKPDKELLNACSALYRSIARVLKLYRGARISFSLSLAEFGIIVIWFAGATAAAWLGISVWGLGPSDVANILLYWTAVLLGLMGISALSSLKS
jgi:hypothetical protein